MRLTMIVNNKQSYSLLTTSKLAMISTSARAVCLCCAGKCCPQDVQGAAALTTAAAAPRWQAGSGSSSSRLTLLLFLRSSTRSAAAGLQQLEARGPFRAGQCCRNSSQLQCSRGRWLLQQERQQHDTTSGSPRGVLCDCVTSKQLWGMAQASCSLCPSQAGVPALPQHVLSVLIGAISSLTRHICNVHGIVDVLSRS